VRVYIYCHYITSIGYTKCYMQITTNKVSYGKQISRQHSCHRNVVSSE